MVEMMAASTVVVKAEMKVSQMAVVKAETMAD